MSGELETLLKMVADGRISAEEAAPLVAALQDAGRYRAGDRAGGNGAGTGEPIAREGGRAGQSAQSAQEAMTGRRVRVFVAEDGRPIVNLQIPLAAAGFAIDQVPGLSTDHRSRIVEAIQSGMTGPILEVRDHGNEVRIVIE